MMKKIKSILLIFVCLAVISLWMSNPVESIYLERVSMEYSKNHHHAEISNEVLKQIGNSERINYFLFSTYTFEYGEMNFYYIGVANNVYFLGLKYEREEQPLKVV